MKRQKITPNPAISSVSVSRRNPDIAERMRRNERILAAAMAQRPEPPPPQPHRDPQPMATMVDPLAGIGWDSAMELWSRIQTPVMFAVWSIGCFLLGRLS